MHMEDTRDKELPDQEPPHTQTLNGLQIMR